MLPPMYLQRVFEIALGGRSFGEVVRAVREVLGDDAPPVQIYIEDNDAVPEPGVPRIIEAFPFLGRLASGNQTRTGIVLTSVGDDRAQVLKTLRGLTGLSRAEVYALLKQLPLTVPMLPSQQRDLAHKALQTSGATFDLVDEPAPHDDNTSRLVDLLPQWDRSYCSSPVANVDWDWDWDTLTEIADGVPHRFDVYQVMMAFGPLSELDDVGVPNDRRVAERSVDKPAEGLGAEIVVNNWYGTTKVSAAVFTPPPPDTATEVPALFGPVAAVIRGLGEVESETVKLVRQPDIDMQRTAIRSTLKRSAADVLAALELGPPPPGTSTNRFQGHRPAENERVRGPKSGIKAAFEPLGYGYETTLSGNHQYRLTKQTDHRWPVVLDIEADPGGSTRDWERPVYDVRAVLRIIGPDWNRYVSLPVARDKETICVRTQAAWQVILGNLADTVSAVEAVFVANTKAMYGSGYAWYGANLTREYLEQL